MWQTPKTDWYGAVDTNGVYTGDRFNAEDFNRIKNNLDCLRDLAITLYEDFDIVSLGDDRSVTDYFYADEINQLEANLNTINENTLKLSYGTTPTYVENGNTMDFAELNRLEGAILDLYDKITNQSKGRRTFQFNFGFKEGF